jgi:ATP-dependent Clp protease protease subunit
MSPPPEPEEPRRQAGPPPGQAGPPPGTASFLDAQLLDRRVVRLWGPLDDFTVSRVCAEMMVLDATGDSAVQLYIGSSGGPLHSALALIDTMDLLGVPVHVVCLGRAEGAAIGVVAAGAKRAAAPHAQFHLSEPEVTASGNASQLAAWAEHHRVELERFVRRLAEATGRPAEHVEADLSVGRWLSAREAQSYGLVDEVWAPGRPGGGPDRADGGSRDMSSTLPRTPPDGGPPPGPGGLPGPLPPTTPSGPGRPFGFRPSR